MAKTESERRVEVYDRAWNGLKDAIDALEAEGHFPHMCKTLVRFQAQLSDAIDGECQRKST